MKKAVLIVLIMFSVSICAHAGERDTVVLSVEDVLFYAKRRDLELKSLSFSRMELVKSKKNLYRSLFPTLSTSFSSSGITNVGGADSRSYNINLTLEQVLYKQLSSPAMFKNHAISLEESNVNIEQRKKAVEQKAINIYLGILLIEEKLKNKREKYLLYNKLLELMEEGYRMGMKTILDVMDTERELLEVELELEELSEENQILYKDMLNLLGFERNEYIIILSDDVDKILSDILGLENAGSVDETYGQMLEFREKIGDLERLYSIAHRSDLDVKKMKLILAQNRLKQRLLAVQFLENISLTYGIDFAGEQFFPANTAHVFGVKVLFDFGVFSSDVSISGSTAGGTRSRSQSAESEVLESLDPVSGGRVLRIESYITGQEIENARKEMWKRLEIWDIKINSLIKTYRIKLKQKDVFQKNEELFRIKSEIGEIKEVDYMDFLIKKNDLFIEFEEAKYDYIDLIWELENVLNSSVEQITG